MNREIKFRAWDNKQKKWMDAYGDSFLMIDLDGGLNTVATDSCETPSREVENYTLCQYTGLKDKNEPIKNCVYEGDIVSLEGIVIGNIHENKEMVKVESNLVIKNMGTKEWQNTHKEAMDRGLKYS